MKKVLTIKKISGYSESRAQNSDTSGQTAPIVFAGFFISTDLVGSVANILNKRACLVSRFELPTPYGLREHPLKKEYKI